MNERQIQIANTILYFLGPHSDWKAEEDIERHLGGMVFPEEIYRVAKFMVGEGLLEEKEESFKLHNLAATIGRKELENIPRRFGYELTIKAVQLLSKGKNFRDYLNEKGEKAAAEKTKAERDEHHKNLQIRDLEEKLKVMNVEQRDFWKEQKARSKHLTILAIISAIFSLAALLKAWGIL